MKNRIIRSMVSSIAFLLAVFGLWLQMVHLLMGHWKSIGTIAFYMLVAVLLLIRKPAQADSSRVMHWVVALGATWLPFIIVPTDNTPRLLVMASIPIEIVAFIIILTALATLGRGFGIIAARREIRTRGIYSYIRHPLYAGEMVGFIAVLMQNPSVYNICLFLTVVGCQLLRIQEEESILSGDPAYVDYRQRVRYRLLPGVF